MAMANREGTFRATVIDKGVSQTGQNNLLTFIPRFRLTQELQGAEWVDIEDETMEITAYVYFEKRTHAVNEFAIQQMRDAFGWDGADPFWLEDNDLPDVQVVLEYEEYNGQQKLRVQWINAYDSAGNGGGVSRSTDDLRKAVRARLGSQLRALAGAGGSSTTTAAAPPTGNAPAPQSGTTSAPPKPREPESDPQEPAASASVTTEDAAWDAYANYAADQNLKTDEINAGWFRAIERVTGQPDPAAVKPEQWDDIVAMAKADASF